MKRKQNSFRMELLSEIGTSFSVYQDMETGVQYIVFMSDEWFGTTPRYNADGSLYLGNQ